MSYNALIQNYSVLQAQISNDLLESETWHHAERLSQPGDTAADRLEKYRQHFAAIDGMMQNESTRVRTQRRFDFVAAHYHSLLCRDMFLRQQMASVNMRAMLNAIMWQSRNEAHLKRNIDEHPPIGALPTHAALKANSRSAEREIKSAVKTGSFVIGVDSRDKRRKWVGPSVDLVFENWCGSLTEYIVRAGSMDKMRDAAGRAEYRRFWTDELGMRGQTFDLATEMHWSTRAEQKDFAELRLISSNKTFSPAGWPIAQKRG